MLKKELVFELLKKFPNSFNSWKSEISVENINQFYINLGLTINNNIRSIPFEKFKVLNLLPKNYDKSEYCLITINQLFFKIINDNIINFNCFDFETVLMELVELQKEFKKDKDFDNSFKLKLLLNSTISALLINKLYIKLDNPNIFQTEFLNLINDLKQLNINVYYHDVDCFIVHLNDLYKAKNYLDFNNYIYDNIALSYNESSLKSNTI
jgi:hypothetical protein